MKTLSYTVGVADIEQLVDHELRTTFRGRVLTQSALSAAIGGALIYALIYMHTQQNVAAISVAVLIGLVSFFALPSVTRDQRRKAIRKLYSQTPDTALGPQTMSLGPEGLDIASPNGDSHLRWSAVQRVALTHDHVFIFLGPLKAVILPLHQLDVSVRTEVLASLTAHVPKLAFKQAPAA